MIAIAIFSIVLIAGCGSSSSNLEGSYKTATTQRQDGSNTTYYITLKKISDNSYEVEQYYIVDARNYDKEKAHKYSSSTPAPWQGNVVVNEERYMATLNKDSLNITNSELEGYVITKDGSLKSVVKPEFDIKKVSDDIQTLKDFSPVPENELMISNW